MPHPPPNYIHPITLVPVHTHAVLFAVRRNTTRKARWLLTRGRVAMAIGDLTNVSNVI